MVFFLAIAVIDVANNGLSECMILKNVNVDIFSYLNCLFSWFALTSQTRVQKVLVTIVTEPYLFWSAPPLGFCNPYGSESRLKCCSLAPLTSKLCEGP